MLSCPAKPPGEKSKNFQMTPNLKGLLLISSTKLPHQRQTGSVYLSWRPNMEILSLHRLIFTFLRKLEGMWYTYIYTVLPLDIFPKPFLTHTFPSSSHELLHWEPQFIVLPTFCTSLLKIIMLTIPFLVRIKNISRCTSQRLPCLRKCLRRSLTRTKCHSDICWIIGNNGSTRI